MQNIDFDAAIKLAEINHSTEAGQRVSLLVAPVSDDNDPDAPGWAIVTGDDEDTGHRARTIAYASSIITALWSAPEWGMRVAASDQREAADMGVAAFHAGSPLDMNPIPGPLGDMWTRGWTAARDLSDPVKQAAELAECYEVWRAEG